jgi:hypothetical protein
MALLVIFSLIFIMLGVILIINYSKHTPQIRKNSSASERNYFKDKNDSDFVDFSGGMLGI